ncbi:MAG: Mrp/NBP35 family ATP-binding protein [Deltaproteobacteria bacterium]|nr:Mrp/NBP35 family ATP-binding protein [Deltaproteobacteria bacterium]
MGRKYFVTSGKGGVGKTTVAANLALAKAALGKRTGLLDVDFHGPNVTSALFAEGRIGANDGGLMVPLEVRPNLHVLSPQSLLSDPDGALLWKGPRKLRAISQFVTETAWPELDCFFVDSPPGTGDEALAVARLMPECLAILVTTGHASSLMDARKTASFLKATRLGLRGVVDNMGTLVCPSCGETMEIFPPDGPRALAESLGVPLLARLPWDAAALKLSDALRKPLLEAAPASPVARALADLADILD